jgi:cellulose synthase/poly-beta-1,6-N-acetylglucosamine synthase-like glycosyltransferase
MIATQRGSAGRRGSVRHIDFDPSSKQNIRPFQMTGSGKEANSDKEILDRWESAKMPLVSVIIPTHNRPELLAETLASTRAQTFTDYEVWCRPASCT